jgi:hypothetical protein
MKVLICGGRDFDDYLKVLETLDQIHGFNPECGACDDNITVIIHGAARGADTLGGKWASDRGIPVEVYPAQWNKYGKKAGFLRNTQMLEEGQPDMVVAFTGGRGTDMMVNLSAKAGVQVEDKRDG